MSEESPSVNKLPLEVLGLIMLKLDDNSTRQLEEIKKCRLISPRWYKAVQDLFQDQLFQKCLTHFDGRKYTYGQSRRFGLNVFGSFPMNFDTFKISNSEYYLMKEWLYNMISNNMQNLILQDNHLNLKELVKVLKSFPNIVSLEFIQSSKDMNVAEKMCQLYEISDEMKTIEMIKSELGGTEDFLQKLKIINFKIIHANVLNFFILLLSCSQCELEEISIEFNIIGLIFSLNRFKPDQVYKNQVNYKNFELAPITQLNKFSKSLKKFKITATDPLMKPVFYSVSGIPRGEALNDGLPRLLKSIFNIFNENQLRDLKNLQDLQITIWREKFYKNEAGLLDFIKSQNNLSKVQVGVISESFGPDYYDEDDYDDDVHKYQKMRNTFLENLNSLGVQFGYEVTQFGMNPIIQFSDNLTHLEVDINLATTWRFSDYKNTFPKITSLIIRIAYRMSGGSNHRWVNYDVPVIVEKFPNLKSLQIEDRFYNWIRSRKPQVTNEDLQIIIENCSKLEILSLKGCILDLGDPGLTGLTSEALEARRNSPNLPITSEERTGFPISHLKNLVELQLCKKHNQSDQLSASNMITDLSTIYGFKYETARKFKSLTILNSHITNSGIEVLKRKLPSSRMLVFSPVRIFKNYDEY